MIDMPIEQLAMRQFVAGCILENERVTVTVVLTEANRRFADYAPKWVAIGVSEAVKGMAQAKLIKEDDGVIEVINLKGVQRML